MAATEKLQHNHELLPFGAYVDEGACPRCDQLRAAKLAQGETPHNHRPQPWGKRVEGCPRCSELATGAPRRESAADRAARLDREFSAEMKRHFADPNSKCDHKTCYDW
jgi:phage FluMu protein Com